MMLSLLVVLVLGLAVAFVQTTEPALDFLGQISGLTAACAFFVTFVLGGLALSRPDTPSWLSWAVSVVSGIVLMALVSAAAGLFTNNVTPLVQLVAQVILGGLVAAASAQASAALTRRATTQALIAEPSARIRE